MDQPQRHQLAFVLALVGGIIAIAMGALMVLMMAFFSAVGSTLLDGGRDFPLGMMLGMLGWLAFAAVVGGIIMLASCFRLRDTGAASRSAARWSIVGGVLVMLGGNMLAAGLGIAAGVIIVSAPQGASA